MATKAKHARKKLAVKSAKPALKRAPKPAPKPKKGAKAVDAGQPLFGFATEETLRRGQFGGTPMTFIEGQDVDVPTYIRKAMRLPAG